MSLTSGAVSRTHQKSGTCPHGLPIGMCPICNGLAGGNSTSKRDIPRNLGEMTYNQCAAIGAMLKAQKLAKAQAKISQQNFIQALQEFQKNIIKNHDAILAQINNIKSNLPPTIAIPINLVLNISIAKPLEILNNVIPKISNLLQTLNQKYIDITDKLAAIYGEIKLAIKDNFNKFIERVKKKLKIFTFITGGENTDNEDEKLQEEKRLFELKKYISKLWKNLKEEKDILDNEN